MKFNHFTIPIGGMACDASCPFCVSKMTTSYEDFSGIFQKNFEINLNKFKIACKIASSSPGLTTALLTGKGEPTLYPEMISLFLHSLNKYGNFSVIELQTNGIGIANGRVTKERLIEWREMGLCTIAISVVHYNRVKNAEIYCRGDRDKHYYLFDLVKYLHDLDFSVRICCMMLEGYIDDEISINTFIRYANQNEVEQLTFRPIVAPEESKNKEIFNWVVEHSLPEDKESLLFDSIKQNHRATKLLDLPFGAEVYGVQLEGMAKEQNVCISNCLTETTNPEEARQLIFFPEGRGRIGYSWVHEGATIL